MAKASRRRLLAACKVAALAVALEAALMAMLVATSQPTAKRAWHPAKSIVYDRPLAKTVIEVPTGRTWTVAPGGAETITREGD
ncbi:MAG: hypothetical protein KH396_03980 [Atopobiaceae bacterium]|uniref:hypothetical protein n=1 Tax=Paratractidigestivibacter sp. TaxID=2847316 RepID=UPI003A8F8FB6|nr:hypothetical protein [Atopobiaceae bacterium]